ncbi:MAG: fluoride efflux transporter CrcB [Reyranellaceae bacterium]
MSQIVAIALGGALGSVGRFLVAGWFGRQFGATFSWGTLAVNILGGLAMGLLVELMAQTWSVSPPIRAFLTVGVLGGFTTFSAFSLETVLLLERGDLLAAFGYIVSSVVLSVGAVWAGLRLMRLVLA